MWKQAYRCLFSGMLLSFFCLLVASSASAAVGDMYSLQAFRPYLARQYNTRLGWQGYPVKLDDPHLFWYDRLSLKPLAELEFLSLQGRITTQTLKVNLPYQKIKDAALQEFAYFALESSHNQLNHELLQTMMRNKCQGQWQYKHLVVSLILDKKSTWLRISNQRSADVTGLRNLSLCLSP